MGKNVEALKTGEDKQFVYYDYQYKDLVGEPRTLRTVVGKIKIDKITEHIHYLELAPGDSGSMARAAATAIARYWVKGEIPDKAYFQS